MSGKDIDIGDSNREFKGEARDSRLTLNRKTKEESLRKKLQAEAQEKCKASFVEFGKCAEKEGLLVLFNCREQNALISQCLDLHYNKQTLTDYLAVHGLPPPKPPKTPWQRAWGFVGVEVKGKDF